MNDLTLEIIDLSLSFKGLMETTKVLHDVSLTIGQKEKVALVGESGSGKSVTARLVLGLLQAQNKTRVSGTINFEGRDLAWMTARERRQLRGTRMSMIFQDPVSALNPVYRIENQFHEVLKRKRPTISLDEAREESTAILGDVNITEPGRVLKSFPFQLSGGMNQRVMIAMGLINEPTLLIADEPGTALDVTVQDQTLRLMHDMVEERGTSVFFISHNLGVVREFSDRLYVIYQGRIVEEGKTEDVFANPKHPYTRALLAAVPSITSGDTISDVINDTSAFLAPREVH